MNDVEIPLGVSSRRQVVAPPGIVTIGFATEAPRRSTCAVENYESGWQRRHPRTTRRYAHRVPQDLALWLAIGASTVGSP